MRGNIFKNIKRSVKMTGLVLKKHAPEIMVVAGCTGVTVAAVMACKETLELPEKLDICRQENEDLKTYYAEVDHDYYPEADFKKDLAKQTIRNGYEIVKLYAPSLALGTASIVLIFSSNSIMRKRNASLAAAYATLDTMYRKYRQNVRETFGEDIDRDMRYGIKHEKVEEIITGDDGKEHKVKKVVDVVTNDITYSDYAKFFDESCRSWDKDPSYNLAFLKGVESDCTNRLIANGYLFLNDVYKAIGIEPTIAGQSVGWIYDKEVPVGDNFVDFGIFDVRRPKNKDFVNGYENVILLDFNVDGDIVHDPRLKMWAF